MRDYSTPSPQYQLPGDVAPNRIQDFTLVGAQKVREGGDGNTPAWELDFSIPSGLRHHEGIAPGMQVALLPVNDAARVAKAIAGLKDPLAPLQANDEPPRLPVTLPGRDGVHLEPQLLTMAEAIAHTVDLTRPTAELRALAGIHSDQYATLPVEEFLNLPGVKGTITFEQLLANQPPLENRKYTPSRVDLENGIISILLSEVHKHGTRGTTTGMLADLAHAHTVDGRPIVQGFLDVRKHKLPYHLAGEKPRILVSTGVGIAPHLAWLRDCAAHGRPNHVALMFSGERHAAEQLYAEELAQYLPDGQLHRVLSRPAEGPGKYVGDALRDEGEAVWQALHEHGGSLYLCGNEQMRAGIDAALAAIGDAHGIDGAAWREALYTTKQIRESMSFDDRFYREKWPKHVKRRSAERSA